MYDTGLAASSCGELWDWVDINPTRHSLCRLAYGLACHHASAVGMGEECEWLAAGRVFIAH